MLGHWRRLARKQVGGSDVTNLLILEVGHNIYGPLGSLQGCPDVNNRLIFKSSLQHLGNFCVPRTLRVPLGTARCQESKVKLLIRNMSGPSKSLQQGLPDVNNLSPNNS